MRTLNASALSNPLDFTEGEGFTFHSGLGSLMRATIERERAVLWGDDAWIRFYIVGPGGYEVKLEIQQGWVARRLTLPASDVEIWRLDVEEIPELSDADMARIAAVDLIGHGLSFRAKISQVTKPVLAGHVWKMELIPTGEPIPAPELHG